MASTDRDRGILMAQGAWRTFRHTTESEEAFTQRIAEVAATRGLQSAAEAIAEDCRAHGLQMSASRVLKGLAHDLAHASRPGPQPLPEGIRMLVKGRPAEPSGRPIGVLVLLIGAAALLAAWYWLL